MTDKEKQKLIFDLDLYRDCKVTCMGANIKCEFDSSFSPVVIFQYHTHIRHDRRDQSIRVLFSFDKSSCFLFFSAELDEDTEKWLKSLKKIGLKQDRQREKKILADMVNFLSKIGNKDE